MLLGDCVPQEQGVHHQRADGLIPGVIDSAAILRRQLHVFISAFAPVGGNIRERPFQFSFLSPGVRTQKSGSPGAAKIVVVLHGTLIVQSGHGTEQGCQQIGSGIANLGAVVRDPLYYKGNVYGSYLGEPVLHIGGGLFRIPADPNGGARSASAWAGGGSFGILDAL